MTGADADKKKLISITLDEGSIGRGGPEQEHERAIAIYDLIEANRFEIPGHDGGPARILRSDPG